MTLFTLPKWAALAVAILIWPALSLAMSVWFFKSLGALAFTIRILIPSNLPEKSIFMLLASVNYLSE
jgi:hypothetical protein